MDGNTYIPIPTRQTKPKNRKEALTALSLQIAEYKSTFSDVALHDVLEDLAVAINPHTKKLKAHKNPLTNEEWVIANAKRRDRETNLEWVEAALNTLKEARERYIDTVEGKNLSRDAIAAHVFMQPYAKINCLPEIIDAVQTHYTVPIRRTINSQIESRRVNIIALAAE